MAKTEGTYIWVVDKDVFGHISTNSWLSFMIQRPTIREKCAWVRSNTWRDERPVATGLDRVFSVFRFFDKPHNWQPKKYRICVTATGGLVFYSWVQFDFSLFFSPVNWTCEHYLLLVLEEFSSKLQFKPEPSWTEQQVQFQVQYLRVNQPSGSVFSLANFELWWTGLNPFEQVNFKYILKSVEAWIFFLIQLRVSLFILNVCKMR